MSAAGKAPKSYIWSAEAFRTAIYHCVKHSSEDCSGLLLGTIDGNEAVLKRAIPLFHTHALAPMTKMAFALVEQYCQKSGDSLQILGM